MNKMNSSSLYREHKYNNLDGGGSGPTGEITASNVTYDNSESLLIATKVQGAIDEIHQEVEDNGTAIGVINENLTTSNNVKFQFTYDADSGKFGYKDGADTFVPFLSGADFECVSLGMVDFNVWKSIPLEKPAKMILFFMPEWVNSYGYMGFYSDGTYTGGFPLTWNNTLYLRNITDTGFEIRQECTGGYYEYYYMVFY